MKKTLASIALCGMFIVAGSSLNAQVLVDDNFNRPDGSLVGTTPTPGPGGVWTNHSGTIGEMQIVGGQVVVNQAAGSEDANVPFAAQTVGLITAVFDINVSAGAPIAGEDYEYFAHFRADGDFTYPARLDIVAPNGTGDYTLGLASGSSTAETIFPTDFTFGNTVSIGLSFDLDTGLASLTVGSTTIESTTVLLGETISAFALRQAASSGDETILVDNLVISAVPEPTTLALGGLGLLALLMARRKS